MCFILTPVRLLPGAKYSSLSNIKTWEGPTPLPVNPLAGQKFVFHATGVEETEKYIRSVSHSPDYLAS